MPYLIDGHNLIPKLGLRLDSIDDEMQLVSILQEFCRLERRQVEVYFDGAPPGHAGPRSLGAVKAHFVHLGETADHAICVRLEQLGGEARNWTVVSSDREVQEDAHVRKAQVLSADAFAAMLRAARQGGKKPAREEVDLSSEEVDTWLKFFTQRDRKPK